ncbi:MAG: hypothetical protein HKN04_13810 [Rhodothermaceae bacterium]|nr:hypothetical protein [Rhodothermaceae bacterium]
MEYPLHLSFKIVAVNPQVTVTDATGALVLYVKQKAFRLKEDVTIYADRERTQPLYSLRADRVIDFNASYHIVDAQGTPFGVVRREGMRSIWKSRYDVLDAEGGHVFDIQEDNPWIKVLDATAGEVPFLNWLTGYLFHPSYTTARPDGTPVFHLVKQPAFWEGKFRLDRLTDQIEPEDEVRAVLSLLMMILLERARG